MSTSALHILALATTAATAPSAPRIPLPSVPPPWTANTAPLFLVYETFNGDAELQARAMRFIVQLNTMARGTAAQISMPAIGSAHTGWGSKAAAVIDAVWPVATLHPGRPVFVLDSRDVLLNGDLSLDDVMDRYAALLQGKAAADRDAVIVSAEPQCCVAALSQQRPTTYFHPNGSRAERACNSGEAGCTGSGQHSLEWQKLQTEVAPTDPSGEPVDARYLNAGLVAGPAAAVLALYTDLDLLATEDDQAVLTELFLRWPARVILDYSSTLFGNSAWSKGEEGCHWQYDAELGMMVDSRAARSANGAVMAAPALLHFSNEFSQCYRRVSEELGLAGRRHSGDMTVDQRVRKRRSNYNYAATAPTTASPTSASTAGSPAVAFTLAVTKPLADFTAAETVSVKSGVIAFITTSTSITADEIIRVDLADSATSQRRSTTTLTVTAVFDQDVVTPAAAAAAADDATGSSEPVFFTLDGVQVALAPAGIVSVSVAATASTVAPGTTPPALENDDAEKTLSGGVLAAIIICIVAIVAGGLIVASKRVNMFGTYKLATVAESKARNLLRVSISESFEEGLPNQAPLEDEGHPLSVTVEWDDAGDGAMAVSPAGVPAGVDPLANCTSV